MKLLTSLLLLTPALALPAPQDLGSDSSDDLPVCADKVQDFKGWDLTSFSLTTKASKMAPILGMRKAVSTLSFKVENSILDYAVECKAEAKMGGSSGGDESEGDDEDSSGKQFDGNSEFSCEPPSDAVQNGEVVFSFDESSGRVHMKQRFTCYDDPEYPTYYTGTGEGTADLQCETGEDAVNEGWKVGGEDPFSSREKTCEETEVAVELTAMEAIA